MKTIVNDNSYLINVLYNVQISGLFNIRQCSKDFLSWVPSVLQFSHSRGLQLRTFFFQIFTFFNIKFFNMEWFTIKSQKGQNVLVVNNCIHRLDRQRNETKYFKCIDNCGGRAIFTYCTSLIVMQVKIKWFFGRIYYYNYCN